MEPPVFSAGRCHGFVFLSNFGKNSWKGCISKKDLPILEPDKGDLLLGSKKDKEDSNQEGADLISTVLALTGLPEDKMKAELDTIIEDSGHSQQSLTLDELRAAMLRYLDSFQPDFASDDEDLTPKN